MQPLKVDFLRKNYMMCTFRQTYFREIMRLEMLR